MGNTTTNTTDTQTACDQYTWIDGNTYTEDNNTATFSIIDDNGCDNLVTLDLTINYSTVYTDVQTACDEYIWIDGNTYTEDNNTATVVLTNANGCDSIITLDLTINYNTEYTDVQIACNEYTWVDGNTYTEDNNTATVVLVNDDGCYSLVTLDLTIQLDTDEVILSEPNTLQALIEGVSYQWLDCSDNFAPLAGETNQSFAPTTSGTYAVQLIQSNCIDTSACVELILTDIDEIDLDGSITIYPNPTKRDIVIDFGHLQNMNVELYSPLGELLAQHRTVNESSYRFSLDDVAGVYFVRIWFGESSRVYRVVKIMD